MLNRTVSEPDRGYQAIFIPIQKALHTGAGCSAAGCAAAAVAWGSSTRTGFPYTHAGVIGVGYRKEKKRPKRPSRFYGFGLFWKPKNQLGKVGLRS